tara:strand:- start:1170 stop:2585 length:1416 start_codon:yes stop_codon:yes gene_type:complete
MMNLKALYYYLSKMNKVSIFIFSIFCVGIFLSCEKEESETEDCAGVLGGESICGCTDPEAINYDSTATYDDDSCEYNQNVDCAGVVGGNNICGCMDESAVNYNSQATFDDETCQYYSGQMNVLWSKSYEEIGGEMWSLRPVSDGGFIMSLGNATNCVDSQCDYLGQLIRLDANGDIIWEQKYEGSSALYSAIETSDGGFIAAGYFECNTSMDCYPDMYILKTDSDGAVQWSKTESSANNNNDWARDVIQTSDGNYVIAGTWNDDGWNSKASLRKYDTSGELIWGNIYTNSVANEAYELIETDEGDIVFAGYSGTQHGAYKFFVVKTDTDGNQIWKKAKNSVGDAILYSICLAPDGNYVAAGFCNSWRSNLVVKRNAANGNNVWNECIIGEFNVSGIYDITPAHGGGYYFIDERSYLTKINEEGEVIFTEQTLGNQAVIELNNGDVIIGGGNAFLDGGYGGVARIVKLTFDE